MKMTPSNENKRTTTKICTLGKFGENQFDLPMLSVRSAFKEICRLFRQISIEENKLQTTKRSKFID